MNEHTKEPWRVDPNYPRDIQAGDVEICSVWMDTATKEQARSNARRIVACVNACRSIDTNLLESINRNSVTGIHPYPQEQIEHLIKQRDNLLTALKRLTSELVANDEEGLIGHAEPMVEAFAVIEEVEDSL